MVCRSPGAKFAGGVHIGDCVVAGAIEIVVKDAPSDTARLEFRHTYLKGRLKNLTSVSTGLQFLSSSIA